jgi:hypothetical protein
MFAQKTRTRSCCFSARICEKTALEKYRSDSTLVTCLLLVAKSKVEPPHPNSKTFLFIAVVLKYSLKLLPDIEELGITTRLNKRLNKYRKSPLLSSNDIDRKIQFLSKNMDATYREID